jgi:hypothetical protein
MTTIKDFAMKCIWPGETLGQENDGAVVLCNKEAHYFVEGYSYCEEHTKAFIRTAHSQLETQEIPQDTFPWVGPDALQDQIDSTDNGQWGFSS